MDMHMFCVKNDELIAVFKNYMINGEIKYQVKHHKNHHDLSIVETIEGFNIRKEEFNITTYNYDDNYDELDIIDDII